MPRTLHARKLAELVGDFDHSPAYAGLADAMMLLIGDGRISLEVRLPSERDVATALGVSRTTTTRAYATLCAAGYAETRRGSGTFTRVPPGRERAHDRALRPDPHSDAYDLECAAPSAPPQVAAAYNAVMSELPAHLGQHGYFPAGMPPLQESIADTYRRRGLPTDPEQIIVTPGALAATAVVAHALMRRGDRVMIDSPTYPNAADAVGTAGARLITSPLDRGGWDIDTLGATLRQTAPQAMHIIADFHNPTGHLMSASDREALARHLRASGTTAIVDESLCALNLDDVPMPPPFATFASDAVSIGSASKAYWGGLRLGWIRAPHALVPKIVDARVSMDLGAAVVEQLVLIRLLTDGDDVLATQLARIRQQRDRLAAAITTALPEWRFTVPAGGLCMWCELPESASTTLSSTAERHGVILPPGPVFSVEGGLDRFIRIPYTRPADELEAAVDLLATAWAEARDRPTGRDARRVMVA